LPALNKGRPWKHGRPFPFVVGDGRDYGKSLSASTKNWMADAVRPVAHSSLPLAWVGVFSRGNSGPTLVAQNATRMGHQP